MDLLKPTLTILSEGRTLSCAEATKAFEIILNGDATPSQVGAFLTALRVRGETVDEIASGVNVMRANALKVKTPTHVLDTCGTGGDGSGSYNISTAVALVCAACGAYVAKHGNRALSSKSGSSEVLESLGVKLALSPTALEQCINDVGIGFCLRPITTQRCAMSARRAKSLALEQFSICSGRCPIRPVPIGNCSASSPQNGSSRWPMC
jgi:anthranilate phosphoribosyltransferase